MADESLVEFLHAEIVNYITNTSEEKVGFYYFTFHIEPL